MASQLRGALRGEGMAADVAIKGEDAVWMAGATNYEAVVLDVMLAGIDGFETVLRLRTPGAVATGSDADRTAEPRGPGRRTRRRRRRLP